MINLMIHGPQLHCLLMRSKWDSGCRPSIKVGPVIATQMVPCFLLTLFWAWGEVFPHQFAS